MPTANDQRLREEPPKAFDHTVQLAYVLAYRAPTYIRTESLLVALRSISGVKVVVARNRLSGVRRYVQTWNALRRLGRTPDIYVIGFRGHEIFWPVRWLRRGVPIIFDAMMSPYGSLHDEHDGSALRRCLARMLYPLERRMLQRADLVLTDTQLNAAFFAQTFALPLEHFCAVPVGAIEAENSIVASNIRKDGTFNVLFYGSFLPLHGIHVIVAAAAQLTDLPIRFDFVGGSKTHARRLHSLCRTLEVKNFTHRRWVALEQLLQRDIPNADLCLGGPFGGTPQARRVVTTKTSQCLALGKATVIGHIDEDYGFLDRGNCLLVAQADADALAASVRWAYENRSSLSALGARGRDAYHELLSTRVISARLQPALAQLMAASKKKQAK